MITRILLVLAAAATVLLLTPPDIASAGGCGSVQYSPRADEPPGNPLEPTPADPRCHRAALTGSGVVAGAAVLAAAALLSVRYSRGGQAPSPVAAAAVAPGSTTGAAASAAQAAGQPASKPVPMVIRAGGHAPVPPGPTPPGLHAGNARHDMFRRMFPELLGRNLMHWYANDPAWSNNCQSTSVTAEHVFRGDDAVAIPRSGFPDPRLDIFREGQGLKQPSGFWRERMARPLGLEARDWKIVNGYEHVAKLLGAAGDGSRGILYGYYYHHGIQAPVAHVHNVVNRGGVICLVDLQTGTWANLGPYTRFEFLRTH